VVDGFAEFYSLGEEVNLLKLIVMTADKSLYGTENRCHLMRGDINFTRDDPIVRFEINPGKLPLGAS
jgi:hypothetical protein